MSDDAKKTFERYIHFIKKIEKRLAERYDNV